MELYGIPPFFTLKVDTIMITGGEKSALTAGASAPTEFLQVPESTLTLESPFVTTAQDCSSAV